jgi:hypothetical protein
MQGVILDICPTATTVTISHEIPPQDVETAGFVLYQIYKYYPARTVHCVVVDPGVGTNRRAVAVRTDHGTFVGPDNGLFSLVLQAVEVLEAVTLTNPDYQLPVVSTTFHGRDIFAPAAAHIANGIPLSKIGPPAPDLIQQPAQTTNPGQSRIIHIDHFGNLVLDITAQEVDRPDRLTFELGGERITGLRQTFGEVEEGELVAYIGSTHNHIEIGMRNGNAAQTLDVRRHDVVSVKQ